jgi:hypothetical protein
MYRRREVWKDKKMEVRGELDEWGKRDMVEREGVGEGGEKIRKNIEMHHL